VKLLTAGVTSRRRTIKSIATVSNLPSKRLKGRGRHAEALPFRNRHSAMRHYHRRVPGTISGDVVGRFRTDPSGAATLRGVLSPDPKNATPLIAWSAVPAHNDEFLIPPAYQYREAFVCSVAMSRDTPWMWCPYTHVRPRCGVGAGVDQASQEIRRIFQTRSLLRRAARGAVASAADLAPVSPTAIAAPKLCHLAQAVETDWSLLTGRRFAAIFPETPRPGFMTRLSSMSWRCRSSDNLTSRRLGRGG